MSGSSSDTIEGASFSVMVPGSGSPPSPTYAELARLGAVDATDEPQLPIDPNTPTGTTFGDDSVASPFAAGGLTYTVNTIQQVGPQGYLRVGEPSDYEWWLTNDPTNPQAPTKPGSVSAANLDPPLGGQGIALHSSNQISLFAPTINQTSNTALNVTWSSSERIGILSGQAEDEAGTMTNATYQVVDDLTTTVGNVLSTVAGQSATVWTGADASTGLGSLLWSNYGVTQNIFAGMITNMTNGNVEVQGWGETKFSDQTVFSPAKILLAISGIADPTTLTSRFTKATIAINATSALLIGAVATTVAAETGIAADRAGKDKGGKDALMTALKAFKTEMWVLTGLVAALQIAGTALGIVLAATETATEAGASSSIKLENGSIVLSAGGTTVTINGDGFEVDAGDPANYVLAVANMGTVSVQAPIGMGAQATLSQAMGPVPGNVLAPIPPLPIQTVKFKSPGTFSAAATQISFTLPV